MESKSYTVAILMATYNGADFLSQQLDSYNNQTYKDWSLYASDDGSTDDTLDILKKFREKNSRCEIYDGPRQGFAKNFMSLIQNDQINAKYFAFSDQDDIWINDKLERAIRFLDSIGDDKPALFCSRTALINDKNIPIGYSPLFSKAPSFKNSILQNIASGNTMVFNSLARDLLRKLADQQLVAHDWTLYQIVTASGGEVFFDKRPTLLYRQHANNLIGNEMRFSTRAKRFYKALRNEKKKRWNNTNIKNLSFISSSLTSESINIIDNFEEMRRSNFFKRLKLYCSSGLYHQTLLGSMTNIIYVMLNKL